ncbi:MAG: DNA-directed RNA polymerase subunit H [Candidatus Micrarchaeota archaeon]|nr:DNA-directed RNA polymerase subunit H [Candidatus Micrarchaeota archaeon]
MAPDKEQSIVSYENLLVPKHEILSESEAKKDLHELKTTPEKLPRIFTTDPALAGKAKPGQIVKISREDGGKKYQYYRVVVEG